MENYIYKCEVCGFIYLVPAYWTSFNPESEVEFSHINIKTGEECSHDKLILLKEDI